MIWNYIKITWRNLYRNKVYSLINILGLSLGLTCAILIILYVKDEVSYDKFHKNGNNIYRVVTKSTGRDGSEERMDGNSGYLQGPSFSANIPEIKEFVRVQSGYVDIQTDKEIIPQNLLYVDSDFFSIFSFPVVYGNPETCLQDPHSVVISKTLAKTHFGTTDAVGKTMMFKEGESFIPYTVTAVTEKTPQNSSLKFDMLLPIKVPKEALTDNTNWFNFFLNTFVVVKPGANIDMINHKIQKLYLSESAEGFKIMTERYGDIGSIPTYFLQPYTDMHLNVNLPPQNGLSDASNPAYSYILSGIALFILLIACINFVNLTMARSLKRSKEIGIRKVVGGNKKQLVFQFLGESFIICIVAYGLAILLVQLVLPVFNELANKKLALLYLLDVKLITGFIALFMITGLLAGFYPALVLSNYKPVDTLYSRFILRGKNYLQKSLVVLQFALASFLIVATFIIYKQFQYLTTKELGYNDKDLVVVEKNGLTTEQLSAFHDKLITNPNIIEVAAKNGGGWTTAARINEGKQMSFGYDIVSNSYISMLEIKIEKGRNFSKEYPSDPTGSVIVNESFVKEAGWDNPIGQIVDFWWSNEKYTVIGVVKDYHFESLNSPIRPQLFTMKPDIEMGTFFIKIKHGSITNALNFIGKTFHEMFPLNPYSYSFQDDINRKNYESEAKWKEIMMYSAILTIFISCIGLFGLSVFSAEKRIKEIGVRKVLGASVKNVVTLLSKDFITLVFISLFISLPIAWVVAKKWLENYPYKTEPGWQTFALAATLVIFIAMATISFQSIKAAIANPVKSLRTE